MSRFFERWKDYTASKATLFWSCVACIVATMIIGFTWGGWVTGGTAHEMSEDAAKAARAELVASVCVERFMSEPDARSRLASLQQESTWQRDDALVQGGWVRLPGLAAATDGAADLCAERLAAMPVPPAPAGTTASRP